MTSMQYVSVNWRPNASASPEMNALVDSMKQKKPRKPARAPAIYNRWLPVST